MNAQEAIELIRKHLNHRIEYNKKNTGMGFSEDITEALSIVLESAKAAISVMERQEGADK